mmetsp:Transcript_22878/g.55519  ORF Transcript_22878/g.55519 Transcript_22878/m.55519 type:complete len:182 (+) Transcript_22878:2-547(+)
MASSLNSLRYGAIADAFAMPSSDPDCPCCGVFAGARDIKDRLMVPAGQSLSSSNEETTLNFTVFSFQLTPQRACTRKMFPDSEPQFLKWKRRSLALLHEVEMRQADIICLQGIDSNREMSSFWTKKLRQRGYKEAKGKQPRMQKTSSGTDEMGQRNYADACNLLQIECVRAREGGNSCEPP